MTQIITFDPALDKNKHLVKKLSDVCIKISESNDTLAKNYNNTRFIFTDNINLSDFGYIIIHFKNILVITD